MSHKIIFGQLEFTQPIVTAYNENSAKKRNFMMEIQ